MIWPPLGTINAKVGITWPNWYKICTLNVYCKAPVERDSKQETALVNLVPRSLTGFFYCRVNIKKMLTLHG
jgi:hypothetical protein